MMRSVVRVVKQQGRGKTEGTQLRQTSRELGKFSIPPPRESVLATRVLEYMSEQERKTRSEGKVRRVALWAHLRSCS